MHGMGSTAVSDESVSMNSQDMAMLSDEPAPGNLGAMSNCEQICGYCLSYSQSSATISNLTHKVVSSLQADIYSRFVPSDPLKSLFRPPISA